VFIDYRVFYTKTGRLKYISHLDVNRLMQRALKRSGLPVWYSEGFNPHIYITFALPLALGLESFYEVMDFRLTQEMSFEQIAKQIDASLPDDMKVLSVSKPAKKPHDIASALFEIRLSCNTPQALYVEWTSFLDQNAVLVEKKSKKGVKTIDIRPDIQVQQAEVTPDGILIKLLLPAGPEKNISPFLVLDAFGQFAQHEIQNANLCKIDVFTKDGSQFR
jgi:radical SAM-linked protein